MVRLNNKRKELYQQTIQLLLLKKKKIILTREGVKEKVCQLNNSDNFQCDLVALEKQFYNTQLAVFEIQFKIILEEEKLHNLELKEFQSEDIDIDGEDIKISTEELVDSDDNNEDVFHDCVPEQRLSAKELISISNGQIDNISFKNETDSPVTETSSIINDFLTNSCESSEKDNDIITRKSSVGDHTKPIENKWIARRVSVEQLWKQSDAEAILTEESCLNEICSSNDNECISNVNKWNSNENRYIKGMNFDVQMNNLDENVCILPENGTGYRKMSNGSVESYTPPVSKLICKNIPVVHSEEWHKKQSIIQLLNRIYRKRAWLRNRKVSFIICIVYILMV